MIIFFLVAVFKGAVLRPRRLGFGGVAVWIGCGRDGGLAMFLILLFFCLRGFFFLRVSHEHDLDEVTVTQQTGALGQPSFASFRIAQIFLQVLFLVQQILLLLLQCQYLFCQLIPFPSLFCCSHPYG